MGILVVLKSWLQKIKGTENVVQFLSGSEALPLPFSGEEEAEMLHRLEAGEDEEHVKAQLIEQDDLISIGTIGLIKAINSFRSDKNIKLATYASRCIENEILMYLRRTSKLKSEVSFDEPLNTDFEGNELLLSDILGTDSDTVYGSVESGVEKELLKEALSHLSERERRIMDLRFGLSGGEEMTQKDVARRELPKNRLTIAAGAVIIRPTTHEVIRSAFCFLLNNLWGLRGSFRAAFFARKYDRIRYKIP